MKYNYLPHTADTKILAIGTNLNELFLNSALATFNIIINPKLIKNKENIKITLKTKSLEKLFYDWIEELIYYIDCNNFLLNTADIKITTKNNEFKLYANIYGDKISKKYKLGGSVKSMTYSDLKIKKKDNKYQVTFVLDR
jgi:SHS2 domain-containing protein